MRHIRTYSILKSEESIGKDYRKVHFLKLHGYELVNVFLKLHRLDTFKNTTPAWALQRAHLGSQRPYREHS